MNEPTIKAIVAELSRELPGQRFGKIFALGKLKLVVDLRLPSDKYLLISVEPNAPQLYLIKENQRALEKSSRANTSFEMQLRKHLANSSIIAVEKIAKERVVEIEFQSTDEFGEVKKPTLVIQLTGRSSNLFLLDSNRFIIGTMRKTYGEGQAIGDLYNHPIHPSNAAHAQSPFEKGEFETLSESLAEYYSNRQETARKRDAENRAYKNIESRLKKLYRLRDNLKNDIETHGEPDEWKKFGELLLANPYGARREDDQIIVKDLYAEGEPEITIKGDRNRSITEIAESYFQQYAKARNAREELGKRINDLEKEVDELENQESLLKKAIENSDEAFIEKYSGAEKVSTKIESGSKAESAESKYARSFHSSEGYEILVGKRSKDNDYLTFRIARSNDLWLHAADYPGSHVVIRSKGREEIPYLTLHEAAQLAAFYSKARNETKAAVNYTLRKFVQKPKGGAPGLVRLASFKTIIVVPKISLQS